MQQIKPFSQIIVHHSATIDDKYLSWNDIRRYHIEHNGWIDIGYHFGIERIENSYEILIGRPLTQYGAHCKGHNIGSIGICFVGNYDIAPPDLEMLKIAVVKLFIPLMSIFNISIGDIYGHRDFASKTCPGKQFDLRLLKQLIYGGVI